MDVAQYLICFRKLDVRMAPNGISLSHIIKRRIYMEVLGPFDPVSSHFTIIFPNKCLVVHPFTGSLTAVRFHPATSRFVDQSAVGPKGTGEGHSAGVAGSTHPIVGLWKLLHHSRKPWNAMEDWLNKSDKQVNELMLMATLTTTNHNQH